MATHSTRTAPILTPPPKAEPRLTGARVFGVRPGSPFLHTVTATGERPMTFAAAGLPPGLQLDAQTGIITGRLTTRGTCDVTVRASNSRGCAQRALRIVVGDEIALTPPMGWNSWGSVGPHVCEADVRRAAAAMVRWRLVDHGWCYINIDDAWQGRRGGRYGAIQPNEKFGDPGALCADLHALGLKAGTYSTPWVTSYAGFVGGASDAPDGSWAPSARRADGFRHAPCHFDSNDAQQWAAWGFDYCKYDWRIDRVEVATRMGQALRATSRDLVYEISNSAPLAEAAAFTQAATMCRTTGDIADVWKRTQLDDSTRSWALGVYDIWEQHQHWEPFNRPGHWNHPCPLRIGRLGGWAERPLQPTRLTPDEQYSHISLWCLWSAPLIIGCALDTLDDFTLGLLTNDEVLDVNQDPLGRQARQLTVGGHEVLVKDLWDGSKAVGLFNPGESEDEVGVTWRDLGVTGPQAVRDLWRQENLGTMDTRFAARVPAHGVVLVSVRPG